MKNHPNQKLTDEDVEQIRQLIDWKKQEIARINSIASAAAFARLAFRIFQRRARRQRRTSLAPR